MDYGMLLLLAEQASTVVQTSESGTKEIVAALQALVLPIVLVILPIIVKRTRKAEDAATAAAEQMGAPSLDGTMTHMVEKALIGIGEIQGDVKELKSNQKSTDRKLDGHIKAYTERTKANEKRFDHIEDQFRK